MSNGRKIYHRVLKSTKSSNKINWVWANPCKHDVEKRWGWEVRATLCLCLYGGCEELLGGSMILWCCPTGNLKSVTGSWLYFILFYRISHSMSTVSGSGCRLENWLSDTPQVFLFIILKEKDNHRVSMCTCFIPTLFWVCCDNITCIKNLEVNTYINTWHCIHVYLGLLNSEDQTLNFVLNNAVDAVLAVEIEPNREYLLCFNCK